MIRAHGIAGNRLQYSLSRKIHNLNLRLALFTGIDSNIKEVDTVFQTIDR